MSQTAPHSGPTNATLPHPDDAEPVLAGFAFTTGEAPPSAAGVFVLTRRIGPLLYPALIDEAEDIAAAISALRARDPAAAATDGQIWMLRAQPRQRAHIARDLIGKYHPPLNTQQRKGPTAPELAALIPDRAAAELAANAAPPPVGSIATTEAELARLVDVFYAAAKADPLIGPVFSGAVHDWERHARTVVNFWSRGLLGTTRYNGQPFSMHLSLGLTPEHFDRWVSLFRTSAHAVLQPEAAAFAISKVEHMSQCFQTGLFLPAHQSSASQQQA
jgi:truncated hemoglobin YjbI